VLPTHDRRAATAAAAGRRQGSSRSSGTRGGSLAAAEKRRVSAPPRAPLGEERRRAIEPLARKGCSEWAADGGTQQGTASCMSIAQFQAPTQASCKRGGP
jgi:hypothetical protein